MTQPDKPRCQLCWHFHRYSKNWGTCERHPPAPDFPETHHNDYCAAFTPKETPDAR